MKLLHFASATTTLATTLLLATGALAQDPTMAPPAPAPAPAAPPPAVAPPPPQYGGQAAAPMPAPDAGAVPGNSDHDAVVGRLAVGYLGRRTMGLGTIDPAAGLGAAPQMPFEQVAAPVIGIRYWISPMLGIDAGLGFSSTSGSVKTEGGGVTVTANQPGATALIVHGGVPLSLGSTGHFSFQIVPELNVVYATGSLDGFIGANPTTWTHSGLHIDVGARAGAEIQFGFMGIPQLSLQGSVGLRLDYDQTSTEINQQTVGTNTVTWHQTRIATDTYDNPWNIFISNVAALYYF
jgi:hypothetical protein